MGVKRIPTRVEHFRSRDMVHVVGDGSIGYPGLNGGRLVPVLILDTRERPDIVELIRVQQHLPPGDVQVDWGLIGTRKDTVSLILTFARPAELRVVVQFDLRQSQGVLVEQVLLSRAAYIQAGKPGDRVPATFEAAKMSIEVPHTGFEKVWDEVYRKCIVKRMRKNGLSRRRAEVATGEAGLVMKELAALRVTDFIVTRVDTEEGGEAAVDDT